MVARGSTTSSMGIGTYYFMKLLRKIRQTEGKQNEIGWEEQDVQDPSLPNTMTMVNRVGRIQSQERNSRQTPYHSPLERCIMMRCMRIRRRFSQSVY